MKVFDWEGKPHRKDGVWLRQVGAENAVYDPTHDSVHLMNDTALAIWDLCDGATRPDEMVGAICQVTQLPVDVVSEDVERILTEFDTAHLVIWAT
jgi:hypothetical protein